MDGKLMVTPEGLLPSRKITDSYTERVRTSTLDRKLLLIEQVI